MKPYYSESGIEIYLGDCREILPQLPKCDAVITDPPYGMNNNPDLQRFSGGITRRGGGWRKHEPIVGDDKSFDASMLAGFDKAVIWGANHFWNTLPRGGCLVWIKRNDSAFGTFLSDAEVAFVSGIQGVYCFRRVFAGSQKAQDAGFDAYEQSAHPNQKPVELMSWCLKHANGDSVIDPFMGSGTTLVAAKQAGRRAIGIEIEEKYCEIAAKRLSQSVFQFSPESETSPELQQSLLGPDEEKKRNL